MSNVNRGEYFDKLRGNNTYILADSLDDRKRLVIQAKLYTPAIKQALKQAIEKYHLQTILQDPNATFRLLDLGCGEGLYFPILHEFLIEQGTKAQIAMVGVDRDGLALATAQDYVAALGLDQIVEFYQHDLTTPINQIESINLASDEKRFDLVITTAVLMHLPNTRPILSSIYDIMKPGGIFYTRDMRWSDGYEFPSPAFTSLDKLMRPLIMRRIGDDFAQHHTEYLTSVGFSDLESSEDRYAVGGRTKTGRLVLENFLLGMHASRAHLVGLGMISEADFDRAVELMFKEITPELEGHITWINSIAQRPA